MSLETMKLAEEAYRMGVMPYSEYLKLSKVKPSQYRHERVLSFIRALSAQPHSIISVSGYVFPGSSYDEGQAFREAEELKGLSNFTVARISPFCDDVRFSVPILVPRRLQADLQGFVSLNGTLNVGWNHTTKYLWVDEAIRTHPPLKPILDFNDITKLLSERYSAERYFIEPIASMILSSPDIYGRMGGISSFILPSFAASDSSVFGAENLWSIHKDLLRLAPSQYRRRRTRIYYSIESANFSAQIHRMDFALLDVNSNARGAHIMTKRPHLAGLREASMSHCKDTISLSDKLLAKADNPLPISPHTFEIDVHASNMLDFTEIMFDSGVAHQWELSFLPEPPQFYQKRFLGWLDKQIEKDDRQRYLIQQGRLLDPGLRGRYESVLRLSCAYARGDGRHEISELHTEDSLRLQERLLDIIVEAIPAKDWKELEDKEEAANSKKDRRFLRLIQDILSSDENEAPEGFIVEELKKAGYTLEYISRNLRFLLQKGELYEPRSGFISNSTQRFH